MREREAGYGDYIAAVIITFIMAVIITGGI